MPAGSYTTEALLSAVRLRAMLPATDDGNSYPRDADLISLANQEMVAFLVPWILRAREGHFLTSVDLPLVSGQAAYTIPQRATADDVSLVQQTDASGTPLCWPGLTQAELPVAVNSASGSWGLGGQFYFLGNSIVLTTTPTSASGFLRVYFPQRPSQLVAATSVASITAAATSGQNFTITVSGLPTTATFTSGLAYECVHAQPGFEVVALGTASGLVSTTFTFPGALPAGINVGDELALQDTANVMTYVPADLLPLFSQWLAMRLAEFAGKDDALGRLGKGFQVMEKAAERFMGKRDQLGPRKVSAAANRPWLFRPPFFNR